MKKKYQAPSKEFFRLPNNIFDLRLTPIQFTIYAYLVSRSGSKGYCWPTHDTIVRDTGIGKTSVQEALKILKKRQIISVSKHRKPYGFSNNEYTLLNLDNPEVYRDLDEANGLPFSIDDDSAA